MHIVENLKDHMIEIGHQGPRDPEHAEPSPILNNAIPETAIWDCLNCGACMEECPVTVEHVPTIMDMRRYMVLEESNAPETAMNALISLEQRGHPWRGTQFGRTDWADGLDVPTLAEKPRRRNSLLGGLHPALEQRSQAVARSMVKVLRSAKVDFAILGDEETCTGDPARRMGNEYLFQIMATQNIETLNSYNVKKVVTICPHCFNTIRKRVPATGRQLRSPALQPVCRRTNQGGQDQAGQDDGCHHGLSRLLLPGPAQRRVRTSPGTSRRPFQALKLVEMEGRCRQRGFCCGAGGGHMWIEESQGQRVNHVRTDHFLETQAQTVGVSCPFCLQMMAEGIQSKGLDGQKDSKDVLELLSESLEA